MYCSTLLRCKSFGVSATCIFDWLMLVSPTTFSSICYSFCWWMMHENPETFVRKTYNPCELILQSNAYATWWVGTPYTTVDWLVIYNICISLFVTEPGNKALICHKCIGANIAWASTTPLEVLPKHTSCLNYLIKRCFNVLFYLINIIVCKVN